MRFGVFLIVAGYLLVIYQFGWLGLAFAAVHVGALALSAWRRK